MKNFFIFLFIIILISLNACVSNHSVEKKPNIYFDLNNFLQTQIQQLEAQKPLVKKIVSSENKVESKTLQILSWQKELKMFQEADINKLIYKDLYTTKEENLSNGNLLTTYQANRNDLKTRFLAIEQSSDRKNIFKIQAKYLDYNFLYKSERDLSLEYSNKQKTINYYSIQGSHNNLFGSKATYRVESKILEE